MALKAAWVAVVLLAALLVVLNGTFGQQRSQVPEMREEQLANNVPLEGIPPPSVDTLKSIWVKESSESSSFWGNGDELYIKYTDSHQANGNIEEICSSAKYNHRASAAHPFTGVSWYVPWKKIGVKTGLESGDTWTLNKPITHYGQLCVQLWEEDAGFDDDFLGWALISPDVHRYEFNGDSGQIRLYTE